MDLILQIPALIGAQLLQIFQYEWNKSFPVAYAALDTPGSSLPTFDQLHEHGLPLYFKYKWILFIYP